MTRNAKNNTQSNETPNIVLKTIYDDIMRDNANSTLTTKQMRAKLRVEMRDVHIHNSTWIFTQSQYDRVRAMFDATYREKIERRAKRATSTRAIKKTRTKTIANVDANANVDDNANANVEA